ncbi:MAG: glycosyltransferase family 2 protein [Azoarcus sp.]|nr:glycosyltransferase family 2 protein [Azoarcus sp.]
MSSSPLIIAVVVTYHPETKMLGQQLTALLPQVARVIVVDNGSTSAELASVPAQGVELIEIGHNRGLAAAQNIGIERALAADASHVLLMDQDSLPAPDMVAHLLAAFDLADGGSGAAPIAAVGPRLFDPRSRTNLDYLKKTGGRIHRHPMPDTASKPLEVEHLIASGCLIPADVLNEIGLMDESLFIDAIDTEWCIRAIVGGFRLLLEPRAALTHRLGDNSLRLRTPQRIRTLALHSPARQYYIFRNNLLLCRRPYVDWAWRRLMALALPRRLFFYLIFGPRRFAHLRAISAGILDACNGQSGPH